MWTMFYILTVFGYLLLHGNLWATMDTQHCAPESVYI